ncbi:MAG: ABC transporter ATP-binding protein, partial [Frankiales bacterium]|nr:ABC transporter ATP-binding protein [Frankiales bacterium]
MRSLSRDPSVTERRLPPGTIKRIARFAAPYKNYLGWFLALIVVDAGVGNVNPLIYKAIIDDGIVKHRRGLVIGLALLIAGLAVVGAVVNLANRWYSARIGEGLIYDMRSAVFTHIQRMPIAFFTRTQTGALISRINSDVLGAQQAFTGTLSNVVSNVISVSMVLVFMFLLSWQITLLSLAMVPLFIIPARLMATRLQR